MKLKEITNDNAFEYKYLYKRMWKYVKPYFFKGILGVLIAVPVGLMDSATPLAIKFFLDYVINGKDLILAKKLLFVIPFAVIGVAIIQGVLNYLNRYLNDWTGFKMTNGLKKDLFKKLLTMEPAFYDKNSSGLVMNRFLSDADSACAGIILNLKEIITTVTSSLAYVVILVYTSWKLSLFAIIILGSSILPVSLIRKRVKQVSMEGMVVGSDVATNFYETFNGNRIVNSFNLQNYQLNKFLTQIEKSFDLQMGLTKRVGWLSPIMYLVSSFGIAGVLWSGGNLVLSKEMTGGSFIAFVTSLILLYKPVKSFGNTLAGMQTSFVAMNRVVDLFDIESDIKNSPSAVKINTIKDSIKLENVWFEYDEGAPVLKGINLDVKIGKSLALVGNSGGGKTTVANLIPRFYDVTDGSIKIDGINVKEIELESLRQNIAVVFQDNFLFSGTIKENILLGKFDASEEEIYKALKDAYLDEFVSTLPDGINTQIGERGVRLSGGQKQRLAIARAMAKNAPVVILDEATSALDNKSEAVVQKALDKLMENRTVIVIAHRLSTIKNADNIAVVNEGEIIEYGKHEDLVNIPNGIYKNLYEMQFKNKESVI